LLTILLPSLLNSPPSDGKSYAHKDGVWVAQVGATSTDDGLFSKTDKAALDAVVASGGITLSEADVVDIVAGGGLLSKDGSKIVSKNGLVIQIGEVGKTVLPSSIAGTRNDAKLDIVHEFAQMNNSSGAWNQNELCVGGMVFKWSTAAINTGALQFRRAANTSAPTVSRMATLNVTKSANSISPTSTFYNYNIYMLDWAGGSATPAITSPYEMLEITIIDREPSGNHSWHIKALHGGSNNLFVTIDYYGPRYSTVKGTI